jgi:hypothetical protein
MNKHFGILGLMAALLQMGAAGISFAQSSAQKQQAAAEKKTPIKGKDAQASVAVPEHVIYEFYFRRMAFLDDLAKKQSSQAVATIGNQGMTAQNSQASAKLQGASLKELEISDDQKAVLKQVAADALSQAAALDAQAAEIIKSHRAQQAEKKLAIGGGRDKGAKASPDLVELQAERDAIFIKAKAALSKQMTAADFAKIDAYIKSTISPTVQAKAIP